MNSKIKWLRDKITRMNMDGMVITNQSNIYYLIRSKGRGSFAPYKKGKHIHNRFEIY
jgi:Xaa-Pro aminopeptidase